MQDQAFADATRPTPRSILGVRLKPYSIGHELTLQQSGNPLLFSDPGELRKDLPKFRDALGVALEVCSCTWRENAGIIRPRWSIRARLRFTDPVAVAVLFSAYRYQGSACPRMWSEPITPGEEPSYLGAPFFARLLDYGVARFGDAAFDKPLGLLQWLYFTRCETEGMCHIATPEQIQIQDEIVRLEAEYEQEQAEKRAKEAAEPAKEAPVGEPKTKTPEAP